MIVIVIFGVQDLVETMVLFLQESKKLELIFFFL